MLVLSRKVGEKIQIGDAITIEVRRIAGNRVTLALRAPRDVRILRGELQAAAKEFEPGHEGESLAQGNSGAGRATGGESIVCAQVYLDGLEVLSSRQAGNDVAV